MTCQNLWANYTGLKLKRAHLNCNCYSECAGTNGTRAPDWQAPKDHLPIPRSAEGKCLTLKTTSAEGMDGTLGGESKAPGVVAGFLGMIRFTSRLRSQLPGVDDCAQSTDMDIEGIAAWC